MGRTLKRVPMDFDWPWHRVWKGYINPYKGVDCPYCYDKDERYSNGLTKEATEYQNRWYGFKCDENYIPHPYRTGCHYNPNEKPYNLERWEYDFILSKDELKKDLFENDEPVPYEEIKDYILKNQRITYNRLEWQLTEEYCRRNGYQLFCPHCEGEGVVWQTPEIKKLHDEYEWIEPPTGDGYQLWETTSEGSPISPVFSTFEELCEWCADNASTFASFKATKEEWMKMLDDGFVYHQEGNVIMI